MIERKLTRLPSKRINGECDKSITGEPKIKTGGKKIIKKILDPSNNKKYELIQVIHNIRY